MQSDAARLANKWDKTGLLEGLGTETEKNNMSLILENQAKQLVVESSQTGGGAGSTGTFTAGQGEQWAGIALPLVRKVFGQIAAKDFVSVQPMSLPSGLVFFLDFQYGGGGSIEGQGGKFATGSGVFGASSVYGDTDTSDAPKGGLYGAGRWTYSTNVTESLVAQQIYDSASATFGEIGYNSVISSSLAGGGNPSLYKLTVSASSLPNADKEAARAIQVVKGTGDANLIDEQGVSGSGVNAYNFYDVATDKFNVFVKANETLDADSMKNATFIYPQQPTDQFRGDFEDGNTGLNGLNNPIDIPEINIKMKSEAIVAKTKKLKAVYTPEFAQDLNAYHSLDAEAELTSIMSEYISLEIDLEIMGMLIENALTTEFWSAVNNEVATSATSGLSTSSNVYYNTQGQWFQTLGTKINKVSNKIHQLTLRGGANFLVCSPTVATILESIPGFAAADGADADTMNYAFGIQKVGNLNTKYQVYKNPYMTENTILLGFKGSQFLETGATFAPYIPLIMTPLVYDPDTFTPRKGLLTRYAKKMLRPEYYGKIFCSGLDQF
tara:strand:+ start:163 stop:1818 length:1656 start_codon:yes stop_codon:yes gene_type:complete